MIKKLLFLIAMVVFFIACKTTNELVKPYIVSYNDAKEPALFMYNLPATMLEFEVTVKQTQKIKGPYADYGVRFLGLINTAIIERNSKRFEIVNVNVKTHFVQDSANWYCYIHNSESLPSFVVTDKNVLAGINTDIELNEISEMITENIPSPKDLKVFFIDLGMQKILIEEIQTVYREIKTDSSVVKVPVKEYVKSKRNEEELARLAADFITRLKTLRFELVAGLYEVFPDGRSLEATIKEMYDVEKRYVELFTGVAKDTTYTYTFTYTPKHETETPLSKVLCYFDDESGVSLILPTQQYANNNKNQHFIVELNYDSYDPLIDQRITPGGPVYRIPALCNVILKVGDKPISMSKQYINQLGNVYQLPIDVLNSNKYQIEFDQQSGNIRRVNSPLEPVLPKKKR
ncbi:MAG: DUF4831 family protein [Salinivirgaceae bacterium]|nr:DUF4831 family protein [Salinivirgaceae bacterium]MDY0279501.1 DUF4831 family protein [Salinivirgaceae bacterium]